MRDIAIRRGVLRVIADFRTRRRDRRAGFERVFAAGGGPPAALGRDREGRVIVPAITLHCPRRRDPVARRRTGGDRLIDYLVENFEDLVYV